MNLKKVFRKEIADKQALYAWHRSTKYLLSTDHTTTTIDTILEQKVFAFIRKKTYEDIQAESQANFNQS